MSEDRHEEQIRQRFDELKQEDTAHTPSFATVWLHAQSRSGGGRSAALWIRLTTAAALFVAVVVSLSLLKKNSTSESPQSESYTLAISEWESPTRSLLEIPGGPFLSSVPQLDASVWETMSAASDTETIN